MKTTFTKAIIYIFLTFFSQQVFAQTVLTINSCDTVITDPNPVFNGSCTITVKSLTPNARLAFNVEYFDQNYSSLGIYNGPTTASPRITLLGDLTIPNQLYGGQTTGNTITLQFFTIGQTTIQHFKLRIRCVETPQNYPTFQPLPSLNAGGNIQSADYDKDGDLDVLIGGKIFRNDAYFDTSYVFERKPNVLNGWTSTNICSADFDNDGFKDVFITGNTNVFGGVSSPHAAIYKNNGNGTFTLLTTQNFSGAARGGCSVVDFNNDGKPDICYTGSTHYYQNTSRILKLYLNNGSMNFTDANIVLPGISGLINASMDWNDSDGDGDKDLVINGHDGNTNQTNFFTVQGSVFTNVNLNLARTSAGAIAWVDVNMDGKPDIVNRGVATADNVNAIVPELFINAGNNIFNNVITNLPNFSMGSMDWVDYDGDNDMDIVICGVITPWGNGTDAGVYKNNGNGQFARVNIGGFKGDSRIKWLDFNNDGKMDIVGAGSSITGQGGYFIKNMGSDSFKISSFSFTANEYYASQISIEDFNNDGKTDILTAGGSMSDVDCNSNNSSTLVLGRDWRLAGIPKFTEVANLNTINPPLNSQIPDFFWSWGDFDSDGKLDVLASNEPYNTYFTPEQSLRMFKNEGANIFSLAFNSDVTPLPPPPGWTPGYGDCYKQPTLIDIDNDGINELFTSCYNTVFKRTNGQWVVLYSNYAGPGAGATPGCVAVGDYNNDGYADVAVSYRGGGTGFFKNNGSGRFISDAINSNFSGGIRQIKWIDIDNDGDLDLINGNGVLENKNGIFAYINNQISPAVNVAVADFNKDGFKDFVNLNSNLLQGNVKVDYNEQGTMFFDEHEHGFAGNVSGLVWNQSAASFDVDNDGDDDIVYSASLCNTGAAVLVNQGNFTDRLIHVVSPNGAENFITASNQNIKWYGYQIGSTVKIELSRDSGNTWQVINASVNSSTSGGAYTWTVTGPTSVKCLVKITDNSNVSFTDKSDAVFSISIPPVPVANAGRDTTLCKGQSTTIGSSAQVNSTYSWTSVPTGFVSSVANPVVNPVVSTVYYLTVNIGALVSKDTVMVNVSPVNINLADNMQACIGKSYTIGVAAQNGFSYSWSSLPTGFSSSVARPSITALQKTVYYLTVKNITTGCTATDSIIVNADSCTVRDYEIYLYPNPATSVINLDGFLLSRHWQKLEVYDMQKRLVMPDTDIRGLTSVTVNVENLLTGVYFVRVTNFDGGMLVFKFVKM